ncbi:MULTISPECIES: carbohydrate ABC transporter permease [unclassified Paenibacillus]|uniref:carbohydrate ABC transporter permease n=1 Tax=unclassified Paenibacillus TaxID=185978 RepID=UPI001047AC8B|nr:MULTISPECIES: carbohydrate ABC transporter permease [unclassified Paenibacillus]NIK70504.1 putative aldouronate transport system permease protein [Paenibacillus sp. BK720]TCM91000.1 carbohydrate ABC transporter membrane protein 2 (CUT1 family) [Paenibacillus sp. BK033]
MEAATNLAMQPKRTGNSDKRLEVLLYIWAALVLIIVLYPLYFIIIASFSDPSAVGNGKVWLFPKGFTVDGYKELLNHSNIWIGYRNTIVYTVVGTLIGLIVNVSAGYALSRKDLVGRKFLSLFFIFTMFFNGGLVPTFLTIRDFHLYDTFLVMVLPFSVAVFDIIVARTFFRTGIPTELWEAAQIDGCGNLRFYARMVLPLSKPIIAVLALWFAVGQWNSYFNALIYLQDKNLYPLQLILRDILVTNQMQTALGTGEAAQIALRLANLLRYSVIIVATVPIMCIYPFVQKHFNKGVMIGAVKE